MIILIPAYEPGDTLTTLLDELRRDHPTLTLVVVDDGSGPHFEHVFRKAEALGATVLTLVTNRGKGAALKHGLAWIRDHHPGEAVVCADSDGQHRPADITRVCERLDTLDDQSIVLGGRLFTGRVPARSRLGNWASRYLFGAVAGVKIHDTQTGLRGYPASLIDWLLRLEGDRFEYELTVLLEAARQRIPIDEVQIETRYLGQNESSHFRPVIDSLRVMRPMVGYAASSFAAFLIDLAALQVLFAITGSLLASVIGARVISATINFLVNRYLVFDAVEERSGRRHAARYLAVASGMLTANFLALSVATSAGLPLVPAKILVETALYVVSFQLQRLFVFRKLRLAETPGVVDNRVRSTIGGKDGDSVVPHYALSHADSP